MTRSRAALLLLALALLLAAMPLAAASAHHGHHTQANGYDVYLTVTPEVPRAGEPTLLEVTVHQQDQPVSGLFLHLEVDDGVTHTHTSEEVAPGEYRFELPSGFGKGGDLRLYIGFTRNSVDTAAYFTVQVAGGNSTLAALGNLLAMSLVLLHGVAALALIGGTLLVVVLLHRQPKEGEVASLLAPRYTAVAWVSIGLLFLTGFARVFRMGLAPEHFFTTPYGVVLTVKIALATLVAVYLGYVSWRLVPRLVEARAASSDSPREFRLVLVGQLVLFFVLLGTVQVLFMSHGGGNV
ncbi:MAG TPA: CopD family protein [Candidatus Thermoplasmatota archaeon]|nr:CopD family protein [Candidatus Thermoplasmatota archaeon]